MSFMPATMILLVCLTILAPTVRAQDAQIPTALTTAKTVYLVNGGVHQRILERTVEALTKWGRFTLVADAAGSDLTLTVSNQPTAHVYNWAIGKSVPVNTAFLSFTETASGTVLYGATFTTNPEDELKKLRKRLEVP